MPPAAMVLIDLVEDAMPSRDYFTPLPAETIQQIASYLYASHVPDKARQDTISSTRIPPKSSSDLLSLASTCKTLHQQTNNWAHHFLHQHRSITKYKDFKTAKAAAKQIPLKELLQWSSRNCVFCGKKSARSAILMNDLRCCRDCDREQWPNKITKTEALKKFDLREHQILPGQHRLSKLLAQYPGVPPLRYGTYRSAGVLTTMFLQEDVEAFAELAHGDLKGHLKKREEARLQRQLKRKLKADERELEAVEAAEAAEVGTLRDMQGNQGDAREVIVIDNEDYTDDRIRNGASEEMFTLPVWEN
ncbi:hypothetical protein WHR41_03935 [Cladosporium halotolerans]|uniref:F-box domain-containing protein n=1 Tax=Cladosporium halotolerans TaxID=1052096 RepID=A0AB34KQV1_9PEZI